MIVLPIQPSVGLPSSKGLHGESRRVKRRRSMSASFARVFLLLTMIAFLLPRLSAAQEVDNEPARAFNAAAALQNAGLHGRATQKWNEFIAKHSNDSRIGRAHYLLGVCQLHEKKFNESIATLQTVLQRWPDLPEADKAHYNLAMSRFELASSTTSADGLRQSSKDFETVCTKFPQSELADDAAYFRGEALFHAGDLQAAASAYQNLINQHANSTLAPRAYYDLGVTQQSLGDDAAAIKTYQAFLAKQEYTTHELAPEVKLRYAMCLQATGELDRAAEQYTEISKDASFEHSPYAALQLGQIKLDQAKPAEAATLLRDFPTRFPQSEYRSEAIKIAGQAYVLADQAQQAINLLTPLANTDDAHASEAAYWLGRAQMKLKQPAQSLQTFENAIARSASSPFLPYLKFARIDSLYEIPARRVETPPLYESFVTENPAHPLAPQAAYLAAVSAFELQQYAKAKLLADAYLKRPDAEPPKAADVHYVAAESHLLDKPDDANGRSLAETHYRTLIDKYPDHPKVARARLRTAWCLQAAGKHAEVVSWLGSDLSKFEPKEQLPEAQLLIGVSHRALTQHREAVAALNAGIAANESWQRIDEALLAVADSHRALNELDQASEKYRKLVDSQAKSPLRPQALYLLGEIANEQGKPDEALQRFQQVVAEYAQSDMNGPALHALASINLAKRQFAPARDWATRLIDGKASDTLKQRARYVRGLAFHGEANYDRSMADLLAYRQMPVDGNESDNAAFILCLCHVAKKQIDQAQSVLQELLKAKPDFAQADRAYYELGHALRLAEGKADDAAKAFEWIVVNRHDSPLTPESYFRLGQHQLALAVKAADAQKETSFQQAEESLAKGLAIVTDAVLRENMQYLLGDIQYQRQRLPEAINTLSKYIVDFPAGKYVGPVTFLAAQARYQLKQFDLAFPLYLKVNDATFNDLDPTQIATYRSQALYRAGECAANLKRWDDSEASFRKLAQEHPKFAQIADAGYGIAFALQQKNQLDAALEAYQKVTESTETEAAAKSRFMMGEIEFGRKKYEEAIEHFLTATVGYPYDQWQALGRFESARCFMELGDKERAAQTLREMIEKHPDHIRVVDAKKLLSELKQ